MIDICERAKQGIPSFGLYISLFDPAVIEMAKLSGYDFARLDAEHIKFDANTLREMFRTARLMDFPLQIRLGSLEDIGTILAMEPSAVMVPHIETKADAERLVAEAKFYPLGQRGMYGYTPTIRYGGMDPLKYLSYSNDHMHTIVQIESTKGLENIDAIASVEGIDMIASGKADLSQSMGIPRQMNDPRIKQAEDEIIAAAIRHGKTPIIAAGTVDRVAELRQKNVQCFLLDFDDALCLQGMKNRIEPFRKSFYDV